MENITISKKTLKECIRTYYEEVNNYKKIKVNFDYQVHPRSLLERPLFRNKEEWDISDLYNVVCTTHVSGMGISNRRTYSFSHELESIHLLEVMKYSFSDEVFDVIEGEFSTKLRPSLLSPQKLIPSITGYNIKLKEKDHTHDSVTQKILEKKI